MASSYVNDLRLNEMATGDASGTWGDTTNTNLELIAEAFSYGTEAITTNADTHTTTIADGATDPGRSMFLKYTGTLDSTCTITIGPNTVSKLWIIENGTSGSQSIIIKQGSGATVTIPSGKTKAIYSDGAGSGGAMVDAFATLNLQTSGIIETSSSIQTPLIEFTDGDDAMTIADGGGVTFAQTATFSDDIIIGDGKTIGSASDVDAMTIAANGQITLTQTLIGTALDISGDIDVDGTTNLDVVDIDGAVDMASTLGVTGVVTANAGVVVDEMTLDADTLTATDDFIIDAATDIILDADSGVWRFKDGGTTLLQFAKDGATMKIYSAVSDADIIFQGNDGGSTVNALTLDMSEQGKATFNQGIVAGTSSAGDWGLILNTSSSDSVKLQVADTGTGGAAHATLSVSDGDLILSPTAERARLTDGGQLLVGTTSKTSADQGNCGALAVHGNTDASGAVCEVKNTGNPASNRDFIRFFNSSGAEAGSIEHNASESVAYNTSSDYRLKENIKPLANGLQRLLQLNPVQFDWKEDKTSSEGFIAHEVQEIFSDAISGEKDGEQTQGMDYGRITPLLVKAIQEQQEQIEGLKQEIQNLKGE